MKHVYQKKVYKELIFEYSHKFTVLTRKGGVMDVDSKYDKKFRWDVQLMYNYIEKVGIVKRFAEKMVFFSSQEYYIMILCSVGLLFLTVEEMKFVHFLPLIGTYLRDTIRSEVNSTLSIDIYNEVYSDEYETIILGSYLDKQDWTTKIKKIQMSGIKMEFA